MRNERLPEIHPIDMVAQLRVRYEAMALVTDVIRTIEEYRIEHGNDRSCRRVMPGRDRWTS